MGIKSRARTGGGGASNQLSPDKPHSKRKTSPPKKGILKRVMGFFRYRLIGYWTPEGRIYANPEFFESGNGFVAKFRFGDRSYRGQVKDWEWNGHGIVTRVGGYRFEGEFKDNLPNGKGKEINADGTIIEGNWVNGEPSGRVTVNFPNGAIYIGNLKDNLPNGKGLWKANDESEMEYEGYWENGALKGPGVARNKFGFSLEGSFINGMPNPFTEHTVFFPENEAYFFKGMLTDYGQPMNGSLYNIENGVEFYTGEYDALPSKGRGTIFYQKMIPSLPFPSNWISYTGEMQNAIPNGYGEIVMSVQAEETLHDQNLVAKVIGNFVSGLPFGIVSMVASVQEEGGDFREIGTLEFRVDGEVVVDSSESPPFSFIDPESVNIDLLSITDSESGETWAEEQASKMMKIITAFMGESHMIPKENYELVNELITSVTAINDHNMLHGGIEQLLRDDEGQNLEFKASIWSNYNSRIGEFIPRGNGKGEQKEKNWNLQDSVIKTIAGFRNAEGGTLLIGVEDKVKKSKGELAKVLGIQSDFRWTKNEDRESYDHALREAIREAMSDKLVELNSNDVIKITYPEFDGKEICRVDVKGIPHGEEGHIWAKTKKLGKETFFVRSSDSTRQLSGPEVTKYILRHLKKKAGEL